MLEAISPFAQATTVDAAPAGGAELFEVIAATGGATVATLALVALGFAHRTGRTNLLRRIAGFAARDTGLAPFAALPSMLAAASLLIALLGMMWDISLHIAEGRDEGPLANPAHYLILAGLFGTFAAGFLAIVLPEDRPSPRAVRVSGDWYAPLGGVALLAASAFALLGFPLDDVWHRIFGQDVTLWGPTHLMLIGGAGITLIGTSILLIEGREGEPRQRPASAGGRRVAAAVGAVAEPVVRLVARGRRIYAAGGLLLGLSVFQAEFDFGVPQFALVLEPVMLAFAAGIALVSARLWVGPGAAIGAALFFIAVRGVIALIVGPGFGESVPYFPLYLAEAACVEVAALALGTRRPYRLGAGAGTLIGTVGFAGEYAWSHIWMPLPWPAELVGEAWLPVLVTGIAAGMIGGFVGSALRAAADREAPRVASTIPAAVAASAIALVVALNVLERPQQGVSGEAQLTEARSDPERTVNATVRISPPEAAEDAYWVTATAWQGGGFHLDALERNGPGVYQTTEPLPVHGSWKALIRVHDDDSLIGMPVYLPEDSAIPAPAVPAKPRFSRPFIDETEILQRELKEGVPGYLATVAYSAIGLIYLAMVVLLGWILARAGGGEPAPPRPAGRGRARAAPGLGREAPA